MIKLINFMQLLFNYYTCMYVCIIIIIYCLFFNDFR